MPAFIMLFPAKNRFLYRRLQEWEKPCPLYFLLCGQLEREKGELSLHLTAKTITRTVAQDAFEILRTKGLLFQTVTITAKEKLCFCEKTECTPEKCPWAKGHFDRVNDAVYELWTAEQSFSREKILEQAEKWKVCPFEMCLDLSSWVDGVICDYNYVFDRNVKLKRFFGVRSIRRPYFSY